MLALSSARRAPLPAAPLVPRTRVVPPDSALPGQDAPTRSMQARPTNLPHHCLRLRPLHKCVCVGGCVGGQHRDSPDAGNTDTQHIELALAIGPDLDFVVPHRNASPRPHTPAAAHARHASAHSCTTDLGDFKEKWWQRSRQLQCWCSLTPPGAQGLLILHALLDALDECSPVRHVCTMLCPVLGRQ